MTRIALGIEYDGSQFQGWQRQDRSNLPTVQLAVEFALSKVAAMPIAAVCAGRTDAGVHASGQVVHFDTFIDRPERAWVRGTNQWLPSAIRVLWARVVSDDFDARRSATSRRYCYVIYNHPLRPSLLRQYVSWYYKKLDVKSMAQASEYWLGEHDFSSFRASECQSRTAKRHVHSIQIVRKGEQVIVEIMANAFLHHMVRNMVGVLLRIGSGRAAPEWAKTVLEAQNRCEADITAPPTGLYLVEVRYPKHYDLPNSDLGPWFLKMNEGSERV